MKRQVENPDRSYIAGDFVRWVFHGPVIQPNLAGAHEYPTSEQERIKDAQRKARPISVPENKRPSLTIF